MIKFDPFLAKAWTNHGVKRNNQMFLAKASKRNVTRCFEHQRQQPHPASSLPPSPYAPLPMRCSTRIAEAHAFHPALALQKFLQNCWQNEAEAAAPSHFSGSNKPGRFLQRSWFVELVEPEHGPSPCHHPSLIFGYKQNV